MKPWMQKAEKIIDHLIPPALLVLLFIILFQIFYHEQAEHYHSWIVIIDYLIILIFIVDLYFKWLRVKNIPKFLRSSWLEIIAVFPAFLFIRVFEFFALIGRIDIVSESAHALLEAGARYSKVLQDVEKMGATSRLALFNRFVAPLARLPRFAKAFVFYEKPTGKTYT